MKIFNLKLSEYFRTSPPIDLNVQVCKSVSHFNWFARYDESKEVSPSHHFSKITTVPKL